MTITTKYYKLKAQKDLPEQIWMKVKGHRTTVPGSRILALFEPEAIAQGVTFQKRVPLVAAYPDCFEEIIIQTPGLPDHNGKYMFPLEN